jgi:hypothetical protein
VTGLRPRIWLGGAVIALLAADAAQAAGNEGGHADPFAPILLGAPPRIWTLLDRLVKGSLGLAKAAEKLLGFGHARIDLEGLEIRAQRA